MTERPKTPNTAATWVAILPRDPSPRRFVMFGAWLAGARTRGADFIEACEEKPHLPESLRELICVARAISSQFAAKRSEGSSTAASWVAELAWDQSRQCCAMFGAWVAGAPDRGAQFREACEAGENVPEWVRDLNGVVEAISTSLAVQLSPQEEKTLAVRRPIAIAGLSLLMIAGLFGFALVRQNLGGWQQYATQVGGYHRAELSDGSAVELNTSSELQYRELENVRELALISGEARFKVAHDRKRPFVVRAGRTVVRALGTEFTIRIHDSQRVTVSVVEGVVSLSHQNPPGILGRLLRQSTVSLTSGIRVESGRLITDSGGRVGVVRIPTAELDARDSWRNNVLHFDGDTLLDVVQTLNRYNVRKLEVADCVFHAIVNALSTGW